jgi:hypothetical protein
MISGKSDKNVNSGEHTANIRYACLLSKAVLQRLRNVFSLDTLA